MSGPVYRPDETLYGGVQSWIPTHRVEIEGLGPVTMKHGSFCNVGEIIIGGAGRIQLTAGVTACRCGCGRGAEAIFMTPSPEHARVIAASLIDHADKFEARAAEQAQAALNKAAGK